MIENSLLDDTWNELDLEIDFSQEKRSVAGSDSWNDSESWILDEPWIEDGSWDDGNLSESLTIKYLGPLAVRAV